jgi:hypothetical protein
LYLVLPQDGAGSFFDADSLVMADDDAEDCDQGEEEEARPQKYQKYE